MQKTLVNYIRCLTIINREVLKPNLSSVFAIMFFSSFLVFSEVNFVDSCELLEGTISYKRIYVKDW